MDIQNELQRLALPAALGALVAAAAAPAVVRALPPPAVAASIDNFAFNPEVLEVAAGTTVSWTNRDGIPHGIAFDAGAFPRSKAVDNGGSFSFTFTRPGTFKYFCYIHPHMVGTIVVGGAAGAGAAP